MRLQFVDGCILIGMCPTALYALACLPQAEVIVLAVGIQYMLDDLRVTTAAYARDDIGTTALGLKVVTVPELKETLVRHTVRSVAGNALQTTEQQ